MKKSLIEENIDNPEKLEKLYRDDKKEFELEFMKIYPDLVDNKLADYWKIRLEYDRPAESKVKITGFDIITLLAACAVVCFLIKLPAIFNIDLKDYFFYEKNAGLIVFLGLSLYAMLTRQIIKRQHLIFTITAFLLPAVYINLLPSEKGSDSINLAYIHLPLLMWSIYGLIYINFETKDKSIRIDYIKYNGDLAILSGLILIAGGIFTAVTLGLFKAIGIDVEKFFMNYIGIWGAVSVPIIATYIIRKFPLITSRIAPVIANIFSPFVLITAVIYLVSIVITGKDPYNDRDFLLVFNLMILGVMAIIIFSVSETSLYNKQKFSEMTLFFLSVVTLLIDLIALSAILYRVGEFGFTPNRTAVLGSNLLIFGNLVMIMIDLFKVNFKHGEIKQVELTISRYLPIYVIWAIIVIFAFPLIFGMK
jgi:hypothetical protein